MQHKLFRLFFALVLVLGSATVPMTQSVRAAGPWYVSNLGNDSNDCQSQATPCATINRALNNPGFAGGDTIQVAIGIYTGTGNEVVLIAKDATLSGGWDETFTTQSGASTIDGHDARRGITVNSGITTTIDRFIVQNGNYSWGGGISNNGTLTLNNSTISGNTSSFLEGGGIANYGTLNINNSTIRGNKGGGWGGGGVYSNGHVIVNNSTISENSGIYGGGFYITYGTLNLMNSIISNNTAGYQGGADCSIFSPGSATSNGYNIIGDANGCPSAATGDQLNTNPQLGTFLPQQGYYPLLPSSPAIDAGNASTCLPADQRGIARAAICDIGAYEYSTPGSATSLSLVGGNNQLGVTTSAFPIPLQVAVLDGQGSPVTGVMIDFTAPGNGASGTFADTGNNTTSVNTDMGGIATAPTFTANEQEGSYIVSAFGNGLGSINFALNQIIRPANDTFVNAEAITSLPFTKTIDITTATIEPGEVQNCDYLYRTIWYSFTPSQDIVVRANTQGSNIYWTNVNVYSSSGSDMNTLSIIGCGYHGNPVNFMAEAGRTYYIQVGPINDIPGSIQINLEQLFPPANDNFNNAMAITSLPFNTSVDNRSATNEPNEPQWCYPIPNTVWYSFTPTESALVKADMVGSSLSDTIFNVYQSVGSGINGLSILQCAYYGSSATFNVQAGVTYYIQAGSIGSGGGVLYLNLQEIPRPVNADFASAAAITSLPFSATQDITGSGVEDYEPQYCYSMSDTVWYSFKPTENTLVRADTQGSAISSNLNVYHDTGSGISGLNFLPSGCTIYYGPVTFLAEAGQTYYLQAGGIYGEVGTIQVNLEQVPLPANDNFASATPVTSLGSTIDFDNTWATFQNGEPNPSCAYPAPPYKTLWFAFTATQDGSVSASVPNYNFGPFMAVYSGTNFNNLTQLGCNQYSNKVTIHVVSGQTYYFQVGGLYGGGGTGQFLLETTPPPQAGFYNYPGDPSKFDTIQFYDGSYDPGQVGFQTYTWNFGDGTVASGYSATHKYAADGNYQVTHTVTTTDGRTASITQTVQVRTHDVAITKITIPNSANVGQTKTITVALQNKAYPETVQVDLYKSTPNGFVWVATVTKSIPVSTGNKTTPIDFSYTFTSEDAKLGKVTFKVVVSIVGPRDAYPSDNEVISSIIKVPK